MFKPTRGSPSTSTTTKHHLFLSLCFAYADSTHGMPSPIPADSTHWMPPAPPCPGNNPIQCWESDCDLPRALQEAYSCFPGLLVSCLLPTPQSSSGQSELVFLLDPSHCSAHLDASSARRGTNKPRLGSSTQVLNTNTWGSESTF